MVLPFCSWVPCPVCMPWGPPNPFSLCGAVCCFMNAHNNVLCTHTQGQLLPRKLWSKDQGPNNTNPRPCVGPLQRKMPLSGQLFILFLFFTPAVLPFVIKLFSSRKHFSPLLLLKPHTSRGSEVAGFQLLGSEPAAPQCPSLGQVQGILSRNGPTSISLQGSIPGPAVSPWDAHKLLPLSLRPQCPASQLNRQAGRAQLELTVG